MSRLVCLCCACVLGLLVVSGMISLLQWLGHMRLWARLHRRHYTKSSGTVWRRNRLRPTLANAIPILLLLVLLSKLLSGIGGESFLNSMSSKFMDESIIETFS